MFEKNKLYKSLGLNIIGRGSTLEEAKTDLAAKRFAFKVHPSFFFTVENKVVTVGNEPCKIRRAINVDEQDNVLKILKEKDEKLV